MFTGLIQKLGKVRRRSKDELEVSAGLKAGLGDSIAVNGTCLTVVRRRSGALLFQVSEETWSRTNLGRLKAGDPVNIEPSLRLGDELGGHLVSGHVDAVGRVLAKKSQPGGFVVMRFSIPASLRKLAATKGSIAVDGISLTVCQTGRDWFEVALVPHTLKLTTLGSKKPGDEVNLEADMLARYVAAQLSR